MGGDVEVGGIVGEPVVDQRVGQPVEGDQQKVAPGCGVVLHHLDYPATFHGSRGSYVMDS